MIAELLGAAQTIGGAAGVVKSPALNSAARSASEGSSEGTSGMYGTNSIGGDFTVGGGGLGGLVGNVSTNGLLLAGIGAVVIAAIFILGKKRKR